MSHGRTVACAVAVAGLVLGGVGSAQGSAGAPAPPDDAQAASAGASAGLIFAANRGQWPAEVRFRAQVDGAGLWVTDDGLVYDFDDGDGNGAATWSGCG
ncbi:MAG: hypothetical protein ACR2LA_04425 [Acidimicrobiales bacterium]